MSRAAFLSVASMIALAVGAFAVTFPAAFLASKGITQNAAANLWMRETGTLLLGIGIMAFGMSRQPDSSGMPSFLIGNLLVQLGLLAAELAAYAAGTISDFWGVVPNCLLNLVLAAGFAWFWNEARKKSS